MFYEHGYNGVYILNMYKHDYIEFMYLCFIFWWTGRVQCYCLDGFPDLPLWVGAQERENGVAIRNTPCGWQSCGF